MRVEIDEEGRTRVKERYLVSVPLAGRIQRTGLDAGRVRRVDPSG
jgi:HlyD family secretion protein